MNIFSIIWYTFCKNTKVFMCKPFGFLLLLQSSDRNLPVFSKPQGTTKNILFVLKKLGRQGGSGKLRIRWFQKSTTPVVEK